MSNCESFELPQLDVESYQVTEVLRCIIHTILFNRALGTVKPREIDAELFDITWAQVSDTRVGQQVDEKVAKAQNWADRNPGRIFKVILAFYEKRRQQGWFVRQEQRLYWEQWCIVLGVVPDPLTLDLNALETDSARAAQKLALQSALADTLGKIIARVNEKRSHIPPVISDAELTFPFEISVSGLEGDNSSSLFGSDLLKRVLSSQPPSVLH